MNNHTKTRPANSFTQVLATSVSIGSEIAGPKHFNFIVRTTRCVGSKVVMKVTSELSPIEVIRDGILLTFNRDDVISVKIPSH